MKTPILQPSLDNSFVVAKPFRVNSSLVIPKGYKTNGANIPRVFWFIVPPFKPKYLPAVVVHDYLCDKERYRLADRLFRDILLSIENSYKTRAMVLAVRLYHKFRYGV